MLCSGDSYFVHLNLMFRIKHMDINEHFKSSANGYCINKIWTFDSTLNIFIRKVDVMRFDIRILPSPDSWYYANKHGRVQDFLLWGAE